jgi:hypothetical protein
MRVIVPKAVHRDEVVRETIKLYRQPFSIEEIRKDLWEQGFDIDRFRLVQIIRAIPGIEKYEKIKDKRLWRWAA